MSRHFLQDTPPHTSPDPTLPPPTPMPSTIPPSKDNNTYLCIGPLPFTDFVFPPPYIKVKPTFSTFLHQAI